MNIEYSVIVLAFNKAESTRRCLESVLTTTDQRCEVLVVDNGSTDGTARMLEELSDSFRAAGREMAITRHSTNIGAVTGRNQALKHARGKYVVFLDNDVYAQSPGWPDVLARALETEEGAGIVGPTLVFAWDPEMVQFAGGAVSRSGRVQFVGRGDKVNTLRMPQVREVQFVISACMMFRRRLVEEIGGLDEAFSPVQYEDVDFCYRARSRGHRVMHVSTVRMLHDESATTAQEPTLRNRYLVIKHGMIFKRRWRKMFEKEDGPTDAQTVWKPIGRFRR